MAFPIFDSLKRALTLTRGDAYGDSSPAWQGAQVASPWSGPGNLSKVIVADVLGAAGIVTREEAMRVSSIVKARSLIGGLSRYPLLAYRRDAAIANQPAWLSRTDTGQPPQWRMLWTLDDLIFYGRSLWAVRRGAGDRIVDAVRVPFDEWELTEDLVIRVQGVTRSQEEVIYFDGPQDGLLDIAGDDIRAARNMTRTWAARVKSPVPLVELHQTDDVVLEDDEIDDLIGTWEGARAAGGATGFTPNNIQLITHGDTPTDLYVEGRNAQRIDVANFLNLPVALLDGSPATASLTYSTNEGARSELVDLSLSYWSAPIAARLSMDDVTSRTQRIDFDIQWTSTPATSVNPPSED